MRTFIKSLGIGVGVALVVGCTPTAEPEEPLHVIEQPVHVEPPGGAPLIDDLTDALEVQQEEVLDDIIEDIAEALPDRGFTVRVDGTTVTVLDVADDISDDDARFDCEVMGDRRCGPVRLPIAR